MLKSIEFSLRFIGLDDHKSGIFGVFQKLFLTFFITFKNKSSLRTIEAEISKKLRTMRLGQYFLPVLIKKNPVIFL